MKNTNNKSLNDLFREAAAHSAAEADGNVPTQGDVERLLRPPFLRSVPVTQSLGGKLYEHLFSSPLKLELTVMTTATAITLGIFAFWPQNNPSGIVHQPSMTAHSSDRTDLSNVSPVQNTYLTAPSLNIVAPTPPASPIAVPKTIPAELIATADSLHPVDATPEQLAKLGIVLEDNGDIDFYTRDGNEINKFGLPPTWGVRLHFGEKLTDKELAGITVQKSSPRLVTEPDGSKRLFSFKSDTVFNQKNGNQIVMMKMENRMRVAPTAVKAHAPQNHSVSIQAYSIKNNGSETEFDVSQDSSSLPRTIVNSDVKATFIDSSLTPDMRDQMKAVNMDSIMSTINIDSIIASVNVDSIMRSVQPQLMGENMDSAMRCARIALKSVKKIISSMHIDLDTGSINSHPAVQVEVNANDDEIGDDQQNRITTNIPANPSRSVKVTITNGKSAQLKSNDDIDDSDSDNSDLNEPIPVPPIPPYAEMEQAENSLDMSKLVPIRVVNNKNPEHPNELIFWYDPTPEVKAALPEHTASVGVMTFKSVWASVYPNPTSGAVTVHYQLTNAPKAHFVMRNLLGQIVMDGGWSPNASGNATGDETLDLSQLPAGVYLLVTTTESGDRDVERVVVAK